MGLFETKSSSESSSSLCFVGGGLGGVLAGEGMDGVSLWMTLYIRTSRSCWGAGRCLETGTGV